MRSMLNTAGRMVAELSSLFFISCFPIVRFYFLNLNAKHCNSTLMYSTLNDLNVEHFEPLKPFELYSSIKKSSYITV